MNNSQDVVECGTGKELDLWISKTNKLTNLEYGKITNIRVHQVYVATFKYSGWLLMVMSEKNKHAFRVLRILRVVKYAIIFMQKNIFYVNW